jgi:protein-L-isoaspartate(D-aspartate) O-methyltransferase
MALIDELIAQGWLKTERIIKAFKKIKRVDFLPESLKELAELNEALPIGYGQTISQPLVVAFMIELLEPKEGEKILDIGSGSGWTTALLAEIVGKNGKVIGIEIVPELAEFGKKNIEKYNFIEKKIVEVFYGDGSKGFEKESPFDKILCSASVQREIPKAWKEQLKIKGKIVTPIGTSIFKIEKKSKKEFEKFEYPGFVFVPLIEK